ncbi:uncharacterized protein LOC133794905 [Humulus lupulus]|uniref:uncharacterized protein LOC133794905 n=1 Tax=Humulus lupulus TaxID=3486 RepID=UPI002B403D97|nr:uncharacterized protein LOC133794905 [Humulus lupulus]
MPGTWLNAIRKALPCKSQPSDVSDPERSSSVGCLSNLRGCKRHKEKESNCSSKVQGIIISTQHYPKTNITGNETVLHHNLRMRSSREPGKASNGGMAKRVGRAEGMDMVSRFKLENPVFEQSREYYGGNYSTVVCQMCGQQHHKSSVNAIDYSHRLSKRYTVSIESISHCRRLPFSVSELLEGDSSRKIVEIICQTGQDEKQHVKMETVRNS